ncbi:hypothetical protein VARIO8X_70069 [Burkholderiales bacterium 8X]|nr:hypothetical protein VARIO8X_70069 [Burkholderiales bacterium 8X]
MVVQLLAKRVSWGAKQVDANRRLPPRTSTALSDNQKTHGEYRPDKGYAKQNKRKNDLSGDVCHHNSLGAFAANDEIADRLTR